MPRALHRPYWYEPTTSSYRQNTDPWVFGEAMLYSNCKQLVRAKRRPTSMQGLERGSVIFFGSTISGEFCLDTVFVVASSEQWIPAEAASMSVEEAFRTCTARSVATGEGELHATFTLYRGATIDHPVDGMFSFVPTRRADLDDSRFLRPPVRSQFINPTCQRSTGLEATARSPDCELGMGGHSGSGSRRRTDAGGLVGGATARRCCGGAGVRAHPVLRAGVRIGSSWRRLGGRAGE